MTQPCPAAQPFGEGEEAEGNEAHADGEERMEVLDQQPVQPTDRPRITTRYMTKYERARILGTRALQIRSSLFHALQCQVYLCPVRFLRAGLQVLRFLSGSESALVQLSLCTAVGACTVEVFFENRLSS